MTRPVHMTYSADTVSIIADVSGRPELLTTSIREKTGTAKASFRCGPLLLVFDNVATAQAWASALEVTTAQLRIAQDHADELATQQPEGTSP